MMSTTNVTMATPPKLEIVEISKVSGLMWLNNIYIYQILIYYVDNKEKYLHDYFQGEDHNENANKGHLGNICIKILIFLSIG